MPRAKFWEKVAEGIERTEAEELATGRMFRLSWWRSARLYFVTLSDAISERDAMCSENPGERGDPIVIRIDRYNGHIWVEIEEERRTMVIP